MPADSVPETDLARLRRWCADAVPAAVADQVRVELHRRGKSVTLCESRPPTPTQRSSTEMNVGSSSISASSSATEPNFKG